MQELAIITVILVIAAGWLILRVTRGEGVFASQASGALYDLGLDVRRLPDEPRKKFFIEAHALHTATKGRFHPKHLAMRFFTWYHTEYEYGDPQAIVGDGSLIKALILMRQWHTKEATLRDAAKSEMTKIVKFVYALIDEGGSDRKSRQTQKADLVKFAEANGLGKLELEKEIRGSLSDAVDKFKLKAQKEEIYEPEYTKETLSWCCGLFFYAALRMACNLSNEKYHPSHWNSLNHRMITEMLDEHRELSYQEHTKLDRRAFDSLELLDKIVDATHFLSRGAIVRLLATQFGTKSEQGKAALDLAFVKAIDECGEAYLPEFMEAFE